ncbi:hypothetical protein J3A83DRAFT_4190547 [Scleroderma citrinum]
MATEPFTSTTPMNVPTPSTKHMVANAAKVIMEYTDGLQFNNNAVYWQKAVDVVWGQLHVEAVVGDLPASFVMPTYIIAVDCFMGKGKVVDVEMEANIEGNSSMQIKFNAGDKNQEDVLHPEQGWTNSWQLKPDPGHGHSRQQQSKQIKSAASVDTNSNGGAGLSTTVADLTAPDGFSAIEDATQCDLCARQGWVKVAQMEWPSQKNFEVYIQLLAWMLKSKLHDASIMSTIAVSAMDPPTTPTGTVTTAMTYQECLEDVEEDVFLLKWDYVKVNPSSVPVPFLLVNEDHNPIPSPTSPTTNVTSPPTIIRVSTLSITSMVGGTDPYKEVPPPPQPITDMPAPPSPIITITPPPPESTHGDSITGPPTISITPTAGLPTMEDIAMDDVHKD